MVVPNPGSDEALELGCTCPVIDNGHGKGMYGGQVTDEHGRTMFIFHEACPIHGVHTGTMYEPEEQ